MEKGSEGKITKKRPPHERWCACGTTKGRGKKRTFREIKEIVGALVPNINRNAVNRRKGKKTQQSGTGQKDTEPAEGVREALYLQTLKRDFRHSGRVRNMPGGGKKKRARQRREEKDLEYSVTRRKRKREGGRECLFCARRMHKLKRGGRKGGIKPHQP